MTLIHNIPTTEVIDDAWFLQEQPTVRVYCARCWDDDGRDLSQWTHGYNLGDMPTCERCGSKDSAVVVEGTSTLETAVGCRIF